MPPIAVAHYTPQTTPIQATMNGVHTNAMKNIPVVKILEDGSYSILGVYKTYEAADKAVDKFSDKYPNAWVDILDGALA